MYGKYGVDSDGELYKMQQDAIRRARETAKSATLPPEPCCEKEYPFHEIEDKHCRTPEKTKKEFKGLGNIFSGLFQNFSIEDLILLGLLVLLLIDDADDEIVILVLFIFICGII